MILIWWRVKVRNLKLWNVEFINLIGCLKLIIFNFDILKFNIWRSWFLNFEILKCWILNLGVWCVCFVWLNDFWKVEFLLFEFVNFECWLTFDILNIHCIYVYIYWNLKFYINNFEFWKFEVWTIWKFERLEFWIL